MVEWRNHGQQQIKLTAAQTFWKFLFRQIKIVFFLFGQKQLKEEKKKKDVKRLSLLPNKATTKEQATCFNCRHRNQMNEPFDWPVGRASPSSLY